MKRGQSFEYILLLSFITFTVIIAFVLVRGGAGGVGANQLAAGSSTLFGLLGQFEGSPGCLLSASPNTLNYTGGTSNITAVYSKLTPTGGNITIYCGNGNAVLASGCADAAGGSASCAASVPCTYPVNPLGSQVVYMLNATVGTTLCTFTNIVVAANASALPTPTPTPTPPPGPGVTLNSPADGSTIPNGTTFQYTPVSATSFASATLYGNFTGAFAANVSNSSTIINNSVNSLVTTVPPGNYLWNVRVCDSLGQCYFAPANFSFTAQYNTTWTQTSQADFQAGTPTNVDLAALPNSVSLARNNSNLLWTQLANQSTPGVDNVPGMAFDSSLNLTVQFGGNYHQNQTWTYNSSSNAWFNATPPVSPPGRGVAGMAFDSVRNLTVMFGGSSSAWLGDTWLYNTSSNTWTNVTPANSPPARSYHAMAFDASTGLTVLFGGYGVYNPITMSQWYNDTWTYNSTSNTWTNVTPAGSPSARYGHMMAYDSNAQRIVLYGGDNMTGNYTNDTWFYNTAANTWTNKNPAAPPGRFGGGLVFDSSRGLSVMFGGINMSNNYTNETWTYNSTSNVWTKLFPALAPDSREYFSMVYDSGQRVSLVYAGQVTTGVASDLWAFNASNNTWYQRIPIGPPSPRAISRMVFDSRRGVSVLFGGFGYGPGPSSSFGETWLFNASNNIWTNITPAFSPPPMYYSSMAYDSGRGLTVLFGGGTGAPLYNETWLFNSTSLTWTNATPALAPTVRWGAAMAFDNWHNVTILFGGSTGSLVNDTWIYYSTNNSWAKVSPAVSPTPRYMHELVFDSARGVAILFGGGTSGIGQTWEYNYTSNKWTNTTPSISPPDRWNTALTFDSTRNVTVLFAGYNTTYMNDIWLYSNTSTATWTQVFPPQSPSARYIAAADYDSNIQSTIIYGGSGGTYLGDVWKFAPGYYPGGSLASQVFDAGQNASWFLLNWSQTLPANTNVSLQTRTCTLAACADNPAYSAGLSCTPGPCSQAILSTSGRRYIQWQANLTTTDTTNTPALSEVNTTYGIPG